MVHVATDLLHTNIFQYSLWSQLSKPAEQRSVVYFLLASSFWKVARSRFESLTEDYEDGESSLFWELELLSFFLPNPKIFLIALPAFPMISASGSV